MPGPEAARLPCARRLPQPPVHNNISRVEPLFLQRTLTTHNFINIPKPNHHETQHQSITTSRHTRNASKEGGCKHLREGDQGGPSDAGEQ